MGHKRLNKARKQSANTKKRQKTRCIKKKGRQEAKNNNFTIIMKLTQIDQKWQIGMGWWIKDGEDRAPHQKETKVLSALRSSRSHSTFSVFKVERRSQRFSDVLKNDKKKLDIWG